MKMYKEGYRALAIAIIALLISVGHIWYHYFLSLIYTYQSALIGHASFLQLLAVFGWDTYILENVWLIFKMITYFYTSTKWCRITWLVFLASCISNKIHTSIAFKNNSCKKRIARLSIQPDYYYDQW